MKDSAAAAPTLKASCACTAQTFWQHCSPAAPHPPLLLCKPFSGPADTGAEDCVRCTEGKRGIADKKRSQNLQAAQSLTADTVGMAQCPTALLDLKCSGDRSCCSLDTWLHMAAERFQIPNTTTRCCCLQDRTSCMITGMLLPASSGPHPPQAVAVQPQRRLSRAEGIGQLAAAEQHQAQSQCCSCKHRPEGQAQPLAGPSTRVAGRLPGEGHQLHSLCSRHGRGSGSGPQSLPKLAF